MQEFVHTLGERLRQAIATPRAWRDHGKAAVTGVVAGCACVVLAACGGAPQRRPTQGDVARITAAVSDIVYQCQSVASGFIAAPDATSLAKDVNALMDADRRVLSNVTFVVGSPAGITRRTTLSREIALAEHNLLTGDCSRAQAERLERETQA